jgi:hypothetical protein
MIKCTASPLAAPVARPLVDLVVDGGSVVRQFFTRLYVSHSNAHGPALYTDIGAAGVMAEEHPPFALVLAYQAHKGAICERDNG